jgi:LPXTG-motif cell wall-anchored protein
MRERSSHLRRMGVGLGTIAAGSLVLLGALSGPAAAGDEAEPPPGTPVEGNPTCAELGEFNAEFKIDGQPEAGTTYDDPNSDFEVTITDVGDGDPMTVSFEANMPVAAVFVKAGPGGILYTFEPPSTTGTDLASPKDSISHLSFCWNDDQATTTTTEHDGTTTTTEHDGTTTTTEHDGTTTTTEHDGTTTTSEVDGTTPTTQPDGSTTTAPDVGATTPSTQPVGGELPRTGSNTGLLVAVAAGLVACGAALVVVTRRMRHA